MSDDRPAVGIGDVDLYAQVRGAQIQVSGYGLATNTTPCRVPEAVAIELACDKRLGTAPLAPVATGAPEPVEEEPADDESKPLRRRKEK
jgi:hypothetical protein